MVAERLRWVPSSNWTACRDLPPRSLGRLRCPLIHLPMVARADPQSAGAFQELWPAHRKLCQASYEMAMFAGPSGASAQAEQERREARWTALAPALAPRCKSAE